MKIEEIDTKSKEGQLLLGAVAIFQSNRFLMMNGIDFEGNLMNPNDVLNEIGKMAHKIFGDKLNITKELTGLSESVPGFIEVTVAAKPCLVNVKNIVDVYNSKDQQGNDKVYISNGNESNYTVSETYEQVKELIRNA